MIKIGETFSIGWVGSCCAFPGRELGISPWAMSKSMEPGRRWLEDKDLKDKDTGKSIGRNRLH